MKKRKKVAIIFIYLENNLGDDLFLEHICRRYPHVDFYVMKNSLKNATFDSLENLHFSDEMRQYFKEFDLPKISSHAKKFYQGFDACVVLGGSIFMQFDSNWRVKLENFKKRININPNTYILGANFGPFIDSGFLTEYTDVFSHAKDVCFRDSVSASYFPDSERIRYAPDILFSYPQRKLCPENKVAISLINGSWSGRPLEQLRRLKKSVNDYNDKIVEICSELARRGVGVSLLSFCDKQGDFNIAAAIESRCLLNGVTDIKVIPYNGDADAVLNELSSSRAVLATRFHAMVLGFLFGKTVYPIIYDEKQRNVLQDMNFYGETCLLDRIGEVDAKRVVDCLLNEDSPNAYKKINHAIEAAAVAAERQFLALDKILKRDDRK